MPANLEMRLLMDFKHNGRLILGVSVIVNGNLLPGCNIAERSKHHAGRWSLSVAGVRGIRVVIQRAVTQGDRRSEAAPHKAELGKLRRIFVRDEIPKGHHDQGNSLDNRCLGDRAASEDTPPLALDLFDKDEVRMS
jgi:hypothetical protein